MSENNYSKDYTDLRLIHTSRYGNSRVFTANYNGKKVIVKALKKECADDAACKASLKLEFETTSILDNKYIRRALDFVQIEGMGDCIHASGIRTASITMLLHRNGIVHCNLNPDNIMVTANDCRVKLIDIGVPETKQEADRELLIKEMEFVAPEIIKGEDFDSRADIYSLGKIMEFIGERNISKQFSAVATHCTQFSREQRFDNISDVRSAITKGHSFVKLIIVAVVLAILAGLAVIYVPKIKANVEKERAERLAVDFGREVEKIQGQLPELCEKYEMKSLGEGLKFDWSEDSLKMVEGLIQYLALDEYKDRALQTLQQEREGIARSRQADFDRLLLDEFKTTTDSIATKMRSALVEPTDEMLLDEAKKWYGQRQ